MGWVVDGKQHRKVRRPTPRFFRLVKQARKSIFNGFKVSGPHVERKLGGLSRVPTVCHDFRQFSALFLLSPKHPLIYLRSTMTCFHMLNSGSSTHLYGMCLTAALCNGAVRGQPVDSHVIICHTSVTCETSLLCLYIYHIRRVNMI